MFSSGHHVADDDDEEIEILIDKCSKRYACVTNNFMISFFATEKI